MNAPIWAPKAMYKSACCKIPYRGYEISIAMDDSCGVLANFSRSDIRVYNDSDDQDITDKFFAEDQYMLFGDAETLKAVFAKIDEMTQGETK